MIIAITGSDGLLGWHMSTYLSTIDAVSVRRINRADYNDADALAKLLEDADVVMHFAGIISKNDPEVIDKNIALADLLISAIESSKSNPAIVYSSSIQADQDNLYGKSKSATSRYLRDYAEREKLVFLNLILPHVFGEFGKPDHNSVVSTFCHRVANGGTPEIIENQNIEPVHAQRVCESIYTTALEALKSGSGSHEKRFNGNVMLVSQLLDSINALAESYRNNIFPNLQRDFDLDLFNTYRSYLFPDHYPQYLTRHSDERGDLVETVRERNGGQVFFSTTQPGVTRGNHFHRRKVERFLVTGGQAEIAIRRIGFDEVKRFTVSGDKPSYVDIPTLHTHNITNTGSDTLTTLFWVNEIFDPENPDTYAVQV